MIISIGIICSIIIIMTIVIMFVIAVVIMPRPGARPAGRAQAPGGGRAPEAGGLGAGRHGARTSILIKSWHVGLVVTSGVSRGTPMIVWRVLVQQQLNNHNILWLGRMSRAKRPNVSDWATL